MLHKKSLHRRQLLPHKMLDIQNILYFYFFSFNYYVCKTKFQRINGNSPENSILDEKLAVLLPLYPRSEYKVSIALLLSTEYK